MDSDINLPCSCSNGVIHELGDKMVDFNDVCIVKHKLYIYRKLIEWHIPRPVRRYLVGKKGICILMKLIPYKERK